MKRAAEILICAFLCFNKWLANFSLSQDEFWKKPLFSASNPDVPKVQNFLAVVSKNVAVFSVAYSDKASSARNRK